MLHHLHHPERTVMFHQIEERLSTTGQGIQQLFKSFIRFVKNVYVYYSYDRYLSGVNPESMTTRDYLAGFGLYAWCSCDFEL
jgi:hypothetical protein